MTTIEKNTSNNLVDLKILVGKIDHFKDIICQVGNIYYLHNHV